MQAKNRLFFYHDSSWESFYCFPLYHPPTPDQPVFVLFIIFCVNSWDIINILYSHNSSNHIFQLYLLNYLFLLGRLKISMIPSQLPLNLRKSNYTQGILLQYLALEVTGNWIFGNIFHLILLILHNISYKYINKLKLHFFLSCISDKRQTLKLAGNKTDYCIIDTNLWW